MASNIKIERVRHGYSQQILADHIGVSMNTLRSYEEDPMNVPGNKLVELARHFHVSTDYLLGLTEDRGEEVEE